MTHPFIFYPRKPPDSPPIPSKFLTNPRDKWENLWEKVWEGGPAWGRRRPLQREALRHNWTVLNWRHYPPATTVSLRLYLAAPFGYSFNLRPLSLNSHVAWASARVRSKLRDKLQGELAPWGPPAPAIFTHWLILTRTPATTTPNSWKNH